MRVSPRYPTDTPRTIGSEPSATGISAVGSSDRFTPVLHPLGIGLPNSNQPRFVGGDDRGNMRRTPVASLLRLLVVMVIAGCGPFAGASPTNPPVCDGIPADFGGCDSARPVFTGTTCVAIADEWVTAIDERVIPIINGPPVENDMQRSSRISNVLVLSSIVAGMRLDELGLLDSCDAPTFLEAAESGFSDELQGGIGATLFDGQPRASRADWEESLFRAIRIIDEGE